MSTRSVHVTVRCVVAFLCACTAIASHATAASAVSLTADRTIDSARFVLKPSLDAKRIVYVRSEAGAHAVWLEELDTGRARMLSDPNRSADKPDIHGSRVVWEEQDRNGSVIILCDLETLETRLLSEGARDCAPSVWGDDVVWTRESGLDAWLMYMDLQTGYQSALIEVRTGTTASLCEGRVVHDSGGNLHLLDLHTAEQETIVDSPHRTEFPDFDGDTVVYARWGGSLAEIGALDLSSGSSAVVVSGRYCSYAPAIDGDVLAWESYYVPSGSRVHLARLPLGSPFAGRDTSGTWAVFTGAFALLGRLAAHAVSFQTAVVTALLG